MSWPNWPQASMPVQDNVAQPTMVVGPAPPPIPAPATAAPAPPPTYSAAQYPGMTPDQQMAFQQNWQQWQTYHQQYAQWHAQYGEQYQREMQAKLGAPVAPTIPFTTPTLMPGYSTSAPPPNYNLPPPLPPQSANDLPNAAVSNIVAAASQPPPPPPPPEPEDNVQKPPIPDQMRQNENNQSNFNQQDFQRNMGRQQNDRNEQQGRNNRFDNNDNRNSRPWQNDNNRSNDRRSFGGNDRRSNYNDRNISNDGYNNRSSFDDNNRNSFDDNFNNRNPQGDMFNNNRNMSYDDMQRGQHRDGNMNQRGQNWERNSQDFGRQQNNQMTSNFEGNDKNLSPEDEKSPEEKIFDEQFRKWEEEFENWKRQNANHPDRKAYREYEMKFEDCRRKLLERREQMRKRKMEKLGITKRLQTPEKSEGFSPAKQMDMPPVEQKPDPVPPPLLGPNIQHLIPHMMAPNMQQIGPNIQQLPPNIQQLPPNIQQLPPNIQQLPPNIQQPAQNIQQPAQNIQQNIPPTEEAVCKAPEEMKVEEKKVEEKIVEEKPEETPVKDKTEKVEPDVLVIETNTENVEFLKTAKNAKIGGIPGLDLVGDDQKDDDGVDDEHFDDDVTEIIDLEADSRNQKDTGNLKKMETPQLLSKPEERTEFRPALTGPVRKEIPSLLDQKIEPPTFSPPGGNRRMNDIFGNFDRGNMNQNLGGSLNFDRGNFNQTSVPPALDRANTNLGSGLLGFERGNMNQNPGSGSSSFERGNMNQNSGPGTAPGLVRSNIGEGLNSPANTLLNRSNVDRVIGDKFTPASGIERSAGNFGILDGPGQKESTDGPAPFDEKKNPSNVDEDIRVNRDLPAVARNENISNPLINQVQQVQGQQMQGQQGISELANALSDPNVLALLTAALAGGNNQGNIFGNNLNLDGNMGNKAGRPSPWATGTDSFQNRNNNSMGQFGGNMGFGMDNQNMSNQNRWGDNRGGNNNNFNNRNSGSIWQSENNSNDVRSRNNNWNDRLSGGFGNDRSSGGFGNDRSLGGFGNDRSSGGFGSDRPGGFGNDRSSGFGNDRSGGGFGNDRSGGFGNDRSSGGFGNDRSGAFGNNRSGNFGNDRPGSFGDRSGFGGNQSFDDDVDMRSRSKDTSFDKDGGPIKERSVSKDRSQTGGQDRDDRKRPNPFEVSDHPRNIARLDDRSARSGSGDRTRGSSQHSDLDNRKSDSAMSARNPFRKNESMERDRSIGESPRTAGKSGSQHGGDDDYFRPAQVIDYQNKSMNVVGRASTDNVVMPTKVVDYGHMPSLMQLNTRSDDFLPMKTIDYGHSSANKNDRDIRNPFAGGGGGGRQNNAGMSGNRDNRGGLQQRNRQSGLGDSQDGGNNFNNQDQRNTDMRGRQNFPMRDGRNADGARRFSRFSDNRDGDGGGFGGGPGNRGNNRDNSGFGGRNNSGGGGGGGGGGRGGNNNRNNSGGKFNNDNKNTKNMSQNDENNAKAEDVNANKDSDVIADDEPIIVENEEGDDGAPEDDADNEDEAQYNQTLEEISDEENESHIDGSTSCTIPTTTTTTSTPTKLDKNIPPQKYLPYQNKTNVFPIQELQQSSSRINVKSPQIQNENEPFSLFSNPIKGNTISIDEILLKPGRNSRQKKIIIIMRGPPGSGKTYVAKLIKDKEVEMGGSAPRLLSIDDYFMSEVDKEEKCPQTGRKIIKKEMVYEYEKEMEENYMQYLIKGFKKTINDKLFDFIIVDCCNNTYKSLNDFYTIAKSSSFMPYIIDMKCDLETCLNYNIHERSEEDIKVILANWSATPENFVKLDVTSLLQSAAIPEVEMDDISDEDDLGPEIKTNVDVNEDSLEDGFFKSKWDADPSEQNLARLDGTSKPLQKSSATLADYLQMDGWEAPQTSSKDGKRVRWADIEEKRAQDKMRAIGFVVGQTDWNRMMDPTSGGSALTKTKYIERVKKR